MNEWTDEQMKNREVLYIKSTTVHYSLNTYSKQFTNLNIHIYICMIHHLYVIQ